MLGWLPLSGFPLPESGGVACSGMYMYSRNLCAVVVQTLKIQDLGVRMALIQWLHVASSAHVPTFYAYSVFDWKIRFHVTQNMIFIG